jgi:hypothetical protein
VAQHDKTAEYWEVLRLLRRSEIIHILIALGMTGVRSPGPAGTIWMPLVRILGDVTSDSASDRRYNLRPTQPQRWIDQNQRTRTSAGRQGTKVPVLSCSSRRRGWSQSHRTSTTKKRSRLFRRTAPTSTDARPKAGGQRQHRVSTPRRSIWHPKPGAQEPRGTTRTSARSAEVLLAGFQFVRLTLTEQQSRDIILAIRPRNFTNRRNHVRRNYQTRSSITPATDQPQCSQRRYQQCRGSRLRDGRQHPTDFPAPKIHCVDVELCLVAQKTGNQSGFSVRCGPSAVAAK